MRSGWVLDRELSPLWKTREEVIMNRWGNRNWECECDGVRSKRMRCDAMTGCCAAAVEPLTCRCILTLSKRRWGRVG